MDQINFTLAFVHFDPWPPESVLAKLHKIMVEGAEARQGRGVGWQEQVSFPCQRILGLQVYKMAFIRKTSPCCLFLPCP